MSIEKAAPVQAHKEGYTALVFEDDFDSYDSIDAGHTGDEGYKWYLDRPFGWDDVENSDFSVSDSILTLAPRSHYAGWGLGSYSVKSGAGKSFCHGYFEARLRFDPALGINASYFPAWWSFSVAHATGANDRHWSELDFFEAMPDGDKPYSGTCVVTVHDWIRENGELKNYQNPNNWHDKLINDDDFHTYGCLWTAGKIEWYLDDRLIARQNYAKDHEPVPAPGSDSFPGCYNYMEEETMMLILGTCREWPIYVDYVRVWQ